MKIMSSIFVPPLSSPIVAKFFLATKLTPDNYPSDAKVDISAKVCCKPFPSTLQQRNPVSIRCRPRALWRGSSNELLHLSSLQWAGHRSLAEMFGLKVQCVHLIDLFAHVSVHLVTSAQLELIPMAR